MQKNIQSTETRENIRAAKELWDQRQRNKANIRGVNEKARSLRSPAQQIEVLSTRRGESRKERARLEALIG